MIERYFKDIKASSSAANNLSGEQNQSLWLLVKQLSDWFVNTSGLTLVDKMFMCYLQGPHTIKQGGKVCSSARLI